MRPALLSTLSLLVALTSCAAASSTTADRAGATSAKTLTISAIPDQDPERLQRLYGTVADVLSAKLGVHVVYKPVTDYTAAVSLFRTGDLQLVWFGGLTGVQARLQTPGAIPLVQRDIDGAFHSLFIANPKAGLAPMRDVAGLAELKGTRFTFGSQSSTSGFLMPAYYLEQAGSIRSRGSPGRRDTPARTIRPSTWWSRAATRPAWSTSRCGTSGSASTRST